MNPAVVTKLELQAPDDLQVGISSVGCDEHQRFVIVLTVPRPWWKFWARAPEIILKLRAQDGFSLPNVTVDMLDWFKK